MPQCPRCGSHNCRSSSQQYNLCYIPGEERLLGGGGGCTIRIYICLECGIEFKF